MDPLLVLLVLEPMQANTLIKEFGLETSLENIVVGPGAKTFQLLFCEAFVEPGDGVLVFSPYFPTYLPNIERRGARAVLAPLRQQDAFRPDVTAIENFLSLDPSPKAIFLNSPHNPTGGVATKEDLAAIADCVRGMDIAVFSDEPYDQMVWQGRHHSILAEPGMLAQSVGAYTFSKSFSMSGWRLGFAVSHRDNIALLDKLTNTAISCVPPFTQIAGSAALTKAQPERDRMMEEFSRKLTVMVDRLNGIDGVHCLMPAGSFYVFPSVAAICNRLQITSHGLAMYFLEGAHPELGVACLGGECFGEAGGGFIRLSSSEPQDGLLAAIDFMANAVKDEPAIQAYLAQHREFRLVTNYPLS